jgi:hypothetical protein
MNEPEKQENSEIQSGPTRSAKNIPKTVLKTRLKIKETT